MHTPGPWTHDPEVIEPDTLTTAPEVSAKLPNGDTRYICRMFGTAPQAIEESQANARLIAAAPELLAACQDCKGFMEAYAMHMRDSGKDAAASFVEASLNKIRAAIAHATQDPTP